MQRQGAKRKQAGSGFRVSTASGSERGAHGGSLCGGYARYRSRYWSVRTSRKNWEPLHPAGV